MRRALRIGAGLGLALFVITCTDQGVTGPKHPGVAALNFSAWTSPAAGAAPVPVDSIEVTLRRPADGSVALDKTFALRLDTLKSDSAVIRLDVDLSQPSETFDLVVRAFGAGVDWYRFTGSVWIVAGATAQPPLTGLYVGPGATAARVRMLPVDTTVVGGFSFRLHAAVYGAAGAAIPGVPIGYRLSDPTRGTLAYPTPYTAILTAALSIRDSVWVVAETPTHLKDSTRLHVVPAATALVKKTGDNQTSVLNAPLPAPLVVQVLDALNGGFKGDTVRWTVTAGSATLNAPFSISDDTGYAALTVTPTAIGGLTVQAAVPGLQVSSVAFTEMAIAGTTGAIVSMVTGNRFNPAAVVIRAGQSVTWMNSDLMVHTTTSDAASLQIWNSGDLATGAVFSVYFPNPGTYTYHCFYHGALGMIGMITVQ